MSDDALHASYRWLARYNAWFNERLSDDHRGQVTMLPAQAGVDPGTTDIVALP